MQKETLATRFGYDSVAGYGTMAVPIYQSTAFNFGTSEKAADRFALRDLGPIYGRLSSPTTDVFEARLAALENGKAAIAVASGQAAIFFAVANLAAAGENIIASDKIYGGATSLLTHTIKRFGIEARVFDAEKADDLEGLIDDKTRAIFFETLSNPQISLANTAKIASIANKHGIVTIADNTIPTPALYNPLDDGADVVIHSASKYISGQGLSIAGAIVSSEGLNSKLKGNPCYAHFNEPDESYHGLVYADLASDFDIYTLRIRFGLLRDIGATLSPFNAFQLIQGLETLPLRMQKHSQNALKIAEFLQSHPKVKQVNFPGLPSSPFNETIRAKFKNGYASGLLSFVVDSEETALKVVSRVKIFSVVVNIGDTKSIITHPASTTHSQLNEQQLSRAGVSAALIRLSIGIEDAGDLIADLAEALE